MHNLYIYNMKTLYSRKHVYLFEIWIIGTLRFIIPTIQ